jgi:hypothetical protein
MRMPQGRSGLLRIVAQAVAILITQTVKWLDPLASNPRMEDEMKIIKETEQIDGIAEVDDIIEIELQQELGFKDKYKLYVHINGITVLRICKVDISKLRLI